MNLNSLLVSSNMLFLICLSLTIRWVLATELTMGECLISTESLNTGEVKATSEAMWESFYRVCEETESCAIQMDKVITTTHLEFANIRSTEEFASVRKACKEAGTEQEPTSLCTVSSELLITTGQNSMGNIVNDYYISKEPVCFPYQCRESQVSLVHSNPLGCSSLGNCMLYSLSEPICPERDEGAGYGNCIKHKDLVDSNQALTEALGQMHSKVAEKCIQYKLDKDKPNGVCITDSDPVKVFIKQNMREFEDDDSYRQFFQTCQENEGQVCYMSSTFNFVGVVDFLNIDLTADFSDYPMCLPKGCDFGDTELIASRIIGNDVSKKLNKALSLKSLRRLRELEDKPDPTNDLRTLANAFDTCPFKNVEQCEYLVSDFYCAKDLVHHYYSLPTIGFVVVASSGIVLCGGVFLAILRRRVSSLPSNTVV